MKNLLHWLGEISYSLYLLHGCVWSFVSIAGLKIRYVLPISVILSFLISHYIFIYLEAPARKIGYKVLKKE
jgi:peptidoglycan/LPS O-acetylase OafA/YrhL